MRAKSLFKKMYYNALLSYRQIKRGDKNILIFIAYGLLYDLFLNLYKPFSVKFLERVGGGAFHISLLNSLPGILAVFALIPGSLFVSRFKNKKHVISMFFMIARCFVLLMAFIPLFPESARPLMFVLLMSIMNFPDAVSQSSHQSFLGDAFDGRSRAEAITLRNKFGQIIVPVITLITGLVVTIIPKNNEQAIIIYQIFFITAFAVGMLEVYTFRCFKEKEVKGDGADKPGISAILATFKDKQFISYLLPTLFFYFVFQAAWPLFSILQVIDLKANELQLALSAVCSGVSGFFGASLWSRLIAKKGNEFATVMAVFALTGTVFLAVIAPNMYVYIIMQIYGGAAGIGVTITLLNGLLSATPDKNRVVYIAVYNTFINISLGISPFFANFLYNSLGTRSAMFVVGLGRVLAGCLLLALYMRRKMREKRRVA